MRAVSLLLLIAVASPVLAQPAIDQAREHRLAGRLDQSERMLATYLRANPTSYRAHYNLGLVFEARAMGEPPGPRRAAHFKTGAAHLERALRVRTADESDFTIYNTLGVMYLGIPDLANAERAFSIGLQNQARLPTASRAKLYSNVGYLFALKGDPARAETMLAQAAALGSAPARANLSKLNSAGLTKSKQSKAPPRP